MKVNFNKFGCQITNEEGEVSIRGIRTKNDCYKWIPESEGHSDMLRTTLKHQKIQALPHFGSKDERRIVYKSSITLKNNQIKVQLHSIKDSVEKNDVPTKDILIDKYAEILDLKKFEKLRDRLDISLRKKL